MTALLVQVRQPSGAVEQLVIDAERVLVGSGAHCDIRLAMDEAALEHLTFKATAHGVYVEALSFDPPPTVNGVPFTQGPLPAGAVVSVGSTQLAVSLTEAAAAPPKQRERTSPVSIVAFVGILIGAYLTFFTEAPGADEAAPRQAPELFAAPEATCPQQAARDQLLALARERQAAADSKRERRPFYVQDGIQAVPLYEQASACYRAAGDAASAQDASAAAEALRLDIDLDYRTHRLRLEHFMGVADFQASRREVRQLLQFTEGKQGDYVTWLSNLDRKLKRKLGRPDT
jgi:hypothetical protein